MNAAISLKKQNKNFQVIVHEKHKIIGYNHEGRRCGEAHSIEAEWKKWQPAEKSIFNHIYRVETTVGKTKYVVERKHGTSCILNRQEFICQLAREAKDLGAIIQTNDKVKSVYDLDGDYIIDASGCPSSIKRELGIDKGIKGITYQQTLEDCNWFKSDTVKVIFDGKFGYYWIFPRDPLKKEVNLGVGFLGNNRINLKENLEEYKQIHNIQGKVNYVLGGLVPAGLQKPLLYENILFVGDAGVGTFPLTGQGIYRALLSSHVAGRLIACGNANKYPHKMMQMFVKWDTVGKTFIWMNYFLRRVGPGAVLTSLKYFADFNKAIH